MTNDEGSQARRGAGALPQSWRRRPFGRRWERQPRSDPGTRDPCRGPVYGQRFGAILSAFGTASALWPLPRPPVQPRAPSLHPGTPMSGSCLWAMPSAMPEPPSGSYATNLRGIGGWLVDHARHTRKGPEKSRPFSRSPSGSVTNSLRPYDPTTARRHNPLPHYATIPGIGAVIAVSAI